MAEGFRVLGFRMSKGKSADCSKTRSTEVVPKREADGVGDRLWLNERGEWMLFIQLCQLALRKVHFQRGGMCFSFLK